MASHEPLNPVCPVSRMRLPRQNSLFIPNLPWSTAHSPERIQVPGVAQSIHALPIAVMPEGHQLTFMGESGERFALEGGLIAVDIVEDARFQDEEAAADKTFAIRRFFVEASDHVAVAQFERPE